MTPLSKGSPFWSTSSLEGPPEGTPDELAALSTQLSNCRRGRLFGVRSAVDAAETFARARFVTTLVIVALAVTATWLLS